MAPKDPTFPQTRRRQAPAYKAREEASHLTPSCFVKCQFSLPFRTEIKNNEGKKAKWEYGQQEEEAAVPGDRRPDAFHPPPGSLIAR